MIKKYRKKSVVIEAILWDGTTTSAFEMWLGQGLDTRRRKG